MQDNLFSTYEENRNGDYDTQSNRNLISNRNKSLTALNSMNKNKMGIVENQKMCLRIWSAYSKFIKSQCNKGKIIDSMFFGLFYREGMNKSNSIDFNDS